MALERVQFLESKYQVKFEFEWKKDLKKYDLIITECSDDLFDQIKIEIESQIKQKKMLSYKIDDLPGILPLFDDKNLVTKSKIEDIQSKETFLKLKYSLICLTNKIIYHLYLRSNKNLYVLEYGQ